MGRYYKDWLEGYLDFTAFQESPEIIHYWNAIGTIGAALERKVYIDEFIFRVFPNFYIIFVGPPNVIRKSSTAGIGDKMLRDVPDFLFGPKAVTYAALVMELAAKTKIIETGPGQEDLEEHSCLYISTGELGGFLNIQDKEMLNLLIQTWDGELIDKSTKTSTKEFIEFPLLSLKSCTTPSWLLDNIPKSFIDGGLFSRVIFVYGDKRKKVIASPRRNMSPDSPLKRDKLTADLIEINKITGEVFFSDDAAAFEDEWYAELCRKEEESENADFTQRKQTQVRKVAMAIAAARNSMKGTHLLLTKEIFQEAVKRIDELEDHRRLIFGGIGQSREAQKTARILDLINHHKQIELKELYSKVHDDFPKFQEFKTILSGMVKAKQIGTFPKGEGELLLISK